MSLYLYAPIYLGGSGDDRPSGIAEDTSGNVYLAGSTASSNFPTVNPLQPTNAGDYDLFVAKMTTVSQVPLTSQISPKSNKMLNKRGLQSQRRTFGGAP
jgi:Beta-propeller repeat